MKAVEQLLIPELTIFRLYTAKPIHSRVCLSIIACLIKDSAIGKLYPSCSVRWFSRYSIDLDDPIGPNLMMVTRKRPALTQLLELLIAEMRR